MCLSEFIKFFTLVHEEYDKNFNTIISTLSVLENKEYDDVIRVKNEDNILHILQDEDSPISSLHKLYNKIRLNLSS